MTAPGIDFVDEAFLDRLQKIRIVTKKRVKGSDRGEHLDRKSGEGLEFQDYRKYQAGDDLRYVDWSVYGRLNRLFIKRFHTERTQTVHLLLDVSRSMGFGSQDKLFRAKQIAAAVGYVSLANLDRICLAAFSDRITDRKAPVRGKKRYSDVLNFLRPLKPAGETDLAGSLTRYAESGSGPGIAVVLSDLLDPKGFRDGLTALSGKKFELHVVQILDPEELFWSKTGNLLLTDSETGKRKVAFLDGDALNRFRDRVNGYLAEIQGFCIRQGIHYRLHDTRVAVEDFLLDYFTQAALFRTAGG